MPAAATPALTKGEIRLKNETIVDFPNYPVSRGVPLPPPPEGVKDVNGVSIRDKDGKAVPSANTVLQKRPDGSIEWMLVDYLVDLAPEEK
jgi:hypothetical protein